MEKYGQYRDKGSGIAPFFPIAPPPSSPLLAPYHVFLFFLRLPFFVFVWAVWLLLVQWTPAGSLLRKANLWCILGVPGVWWIDIRVDGVQRGSLGKKRSNLPGPGNVIASSHTSPLDIIYLAAIFDPIFTQSFPGSRKVKQISLEGALASCFNMSASAEGSVELSDLVEANPGRIVAVFPEATTSNGRGVLRLSPALLSAGRATSIFPVSLRYTPADVVTPIPGWAEALRFLWKLLSRQTHCIRVRIGLPLTLGQVYKEDVASREVSGFVIFMDYDTNVFDSFESVDTSPSDESSPHEQRALDLVAESLSRLGRAKTLGLGWEEKLQFVDAWAGNTKAKKRR